MPGKTRLEEVVKLSIMRCKQIDFRKQNDPAYRNLSKSLGVLDLTALGIGATIGTGIFVLTGIAAARYAGPAVVLSFVTSGFAAALAALVYAEMAAAVPCVKPRHLLWAVPWWSMATACSRPAGKPTRLARLRRVSGRVG